ncbi:hypothetical protein [Caballeronia zhejiangensis]|uniref:hypothetical protein n=1 Tax=Caballeronia zhejiangensis TaxID=871203 RepID=UPI00158B13BA|nr:hypothetical protein [Caballeronia zhejiangensis]
MQVIATLSRQASDRTASWQSRVKCAVIGSDVSRTPWMVALIETTPTLDKLLSECDHPWLLKIVGVEQDANARPRTVTVSDAQPYIQSHDTAWYVSSARTVQNSAQMVLLCYASPHYHSMIPPFARDRHSIKSLIDTYVFPRINTWDMSGLWAHQCDGTQTLETLVSTGETREQLAQRIAAYTSGFYTISPVTPSPNHPTSWPSAHPQANWAMRWNSSLHHLGAIRDADALTTAADLMVDSEPAALEINLAGRSATVHLAAQHPFIHVIERPVRTSTDSACQALDRSLVNPLQARWSCTSNPHQTVGWAGTTLESKSRRIVLSALHVIGEQVPVRECVTRLAAHLGQRHADVSPTGYFGVFISVPDTHALLPTQKVESLLARLDVEKLAQHFLEACELGAWPLRSPPARLPNGLLQAVVASSPTQRVIDRADNDISYEHTIWIQLGGIDGVVRAHWSTPFASRNQEGVGKGDLVLVPEIGSMGYVLLTGGYGMPVFIGATHFRDMATSGAIDANDCKHGLVTDGGMAFVESSTHMRFRAPLVHSTSSRRISIIGNFPGVIPPENEMIKMDAIPASALGTDATSSSE